jgi:hypothetical protein
MYNEEAYDAFVASMEQRFPAMYGKTDENPHGYGGFCIGTGWWPIVESLSGNIQHYIDWKNRKEQTVAQVTVNQIKEKFGGLRFYYSGGDDEISGMVRMAESWAARSCEECGSPGTSRSGGWIRTLCDTHEEARQTAMKKLDAE